MEPPIRFLGLRFITSFAKNFSHGQNYTDTE